MGMRPGEKRSGRRARGAKRLFKRFRLNVELLEDRCVPSRLFLTAAASGGLPGTTINVPVDFSAATAGVGAGDINITYDTSRLTIPADTSILHGAGTVT